MLHRSLLSLTRAYPLGVFLVNEIGSDGSLRQTEWVTRLERKPRHPLGALLIRDYAQVTKVTV